MKPPSTSSSEEKDSFLTIATPVNGLYKDKGSKFLYFAFPVADEEEIKSSLAELRKTYYDATHHCYAWVLGTAGDHFRANDDGEPNHSAGDPILGQIRSFGLSHVLVVVVRYFGGTKLGVSGLINAYKTSAYEALSSSEIIRKWEFDQVKIQFPYPAMNEVMKVIKTHELTIIDQQMSLGCEITLEVKKGMAELVRLKFGDIDQLTILSD